MYRLFILAILISCWITPQSATAQCNTNLGDLSGFQMPQENAAVLDSAACELAAVLEDNTFKVFHTAFYPEQEYYGYYKYPDAFELQRQEAIGQADNYLLIGWQCDSKGINSQFFLDLKLGDVPGTECIDNFQELAKGFLTDRIQKEYDSYYSSPQSASLSAAFGIRKLVEYINDLKQCCLQGGNVEDCIVCEKPSGAKAYLTSQGFRSVQIYNIHPSGQSSSGTIEDLAEQAFMIEDLSTVNLIDQYTNVVGAYQAENMTVKVIITKDENMCSSTWDSLMDIAKSGQYDVVYWHHIHKGSGPEDQWLYTNAWIKGAQSGNKRDSVESKRIATNVVAGLASAATDFLFQVLAHYTFDEDISTGEWKKAVGRVDYWEVTKSAGFGLFGVNTKVAAVASALADATVKTVKLANYYENHPPDPTQYPEGYTLSWAANDFAKYFLDELIEEGIGMLLGGAASKAIGYVKEIPFTGWCKIARALNKRLGTTLPGCFESGTGVITSKGLMPIEKINPGDWVRSTPNANPFQFVQIDNKNSWENWDNDGLMATIEGTGSFQTMNNELPSSNEVLTMTSLPSYDFEDMMPDTWTLIRFEVLKIDSTFCDVQMLRPNSWLKNRGINNIGDSTWLSMPEMGVCGLARVIGLEYSHLDTRSNDSRKMLESGYYPVITTFRHKSNEVLNLYFTNSDKIATTNPHPFWSIDRNGWISAERLNKGECVKTIDGEISLDSFTLEFNDKTVCNLEVWKTHNYYVGDAECLVHNECQFQSLINSYIQAFISSKLPKDVKRYLIQTEFWEHLLNDMPGAKVRGNLFEDLLGATIYKNMKQTSEFFQYIDFFDPIAKIGRSVKSTNVTSASQIVNQWKDNFLSLAQSKGQTLQKTVNGVLESYEVNNIKLVILVPINNWSATFANTLKTQIENLHPNLKNNVVIGTVESALGL